MHLPGSGIFTVRAQSNMAKTDTLGLLPIGMYSLGNIQGRPQFGHQEDSGMSWNPTGCSRDRRRKLGFGSHDSHRNVFPFQQWYERLPAYTLNIITRSVQFAFYFDGRQMKIKILLVYTYRYCTKHIKKNESCILSFSMTNFTNVSIRKSYKLININMIFKVDMC